MELTDSAFISRELISSRSSNNPLIINHSSLPHVISFDNDYFYFTGNYCVYRISIHKPQETELFCKLIQNPVAFTLNDGFMAYSIHGEPLQIDDTDTKNRILSQSISSLPGRQYTCNNQTLIRRSPLGDLLLFVARNNNTFEVFELVKQGATKSVISPTSPVVSGASCVNCITVSNDARLLAACNADGNCYIHQFDNATKRYDTIIMKIPACSYTASFNCDNTLIGLFCMYRQKTHFYNLKTKKDLQLSKAIPPPSVVATMHFSPVHPRLLCYSATSLYMIQVDEALEKAQVHEIDQAPLSQAIKQQIGCKFSDDGRYLFAALNTSYKMLFEINGEFWGTKPLFKSAKLLHSLSFQDLKIQFTL